MRRSVAAFALLIIGFCSASAVSWAQSPGTDQWALIGKLRIDPLIGREALEIDTVQAYKAVRLSVQGGPLMIERVQVSWSTGDVHNEERLINLLDGERTRSIDQTDRNRRLSRIGVIYRVEPTAKPVVLEAWGLTGQQAQSAAAAGSARSTATLLGAATIDLAAERASIPVTLTSGQVDRVRLHVPDNNVFIEDVRLEYTVGDPDLLMVGADLRAGARSRWLEVKPDRTLKEVHVGFRGRAGLVASARLELHGERAGESKSAPKSSTRSASPADPRSSGPTAGAPVADNRSPACIAEAKCTPVPVFFGTNRQRKDDGALIQFTADRGDALVLGQATVTVPRAYRKPGQIPRPAWSDLLRGANPYKEDPARHFTILASATKVYASPADFIAAVKLAIADTKHFKDHAFVFVHGFNVNFEHALYRTAQIAFDLGLEDTPFGTAFLYSWPSAASIDAYIDDLDSSSKAVPHLEAFIEMVVAQSGAKHVHLIAHSMGNQPLLAALDSLVKKDKTRTLVDQVILASPDVDAKDFAEISARILPVARTLTLYASSNDRALLASRKARRDRPRAGDVVDGRPVIVTGLDTIDASSVSTAILDLNHSTYADKKELLNDMRRLMLTNQRPPNVRDLSIKTVPVEGGTFWRFVN